MSDSRGRVWKTGLTSSCCGKQTGRASVLASRRLAYILRLAGTLALATGIPSVFPQQKLTTASRLGGVLVLFLIVYLAGCGGDPPGLNDKDGWIESKDAR